MANPTIVKLQDSNVMPQLELGVWQASNEEVITAIQRALEVGYRSIGTATAYKNEKGVGKTLKNASINRKELFITTKLWNDDHKCPREALFDGLKRLQLDYIDLYLIHWPIPAIDHYVKVWKSMIELQKEGSIKSIGVCNFQIHHPQRLIDETGATSVVNQIELHPLMQQRRLRAQNTTHKIQTESWGPLAQGGKGAFDQKVTRDLVDKCGKTPAQIVIRWHLDSSLVVVPKSVTLSRIIESFDVQDSRLDRDGLDETAKPNQGKRLDPNPDQFGGQHANSPDGSNVPLPDFSEIVYSPRVPPVATLPCSGIPNIRASSCGTEGS